MLAPSCAFLSKLSYFKEQTEQNRHSCLHAAAIDLQTDAGLLSAQQFH